MTSERKKREKEEGKLGEGERIREKGKMRRKANREGEKGCKGKGTGNVVEGMDGTGKRKEK